MRLLSVASLFSIASAQDFPEEKKITQAEQTEQGEAENRPLSSLQFPRRGLQLYSLTASGAYSSTGQIGLGGGGNTAASSAGFMGSALMGWSHIGQRSTLGFTYAPSYIVFPDRLDMRSSGHAFTFSAAAHPLSKWSFNANLSAQYSSADQIIFAPTLSRTAVTVPATFEEFANSILKNPSDQTQLAALLTGSPAAEVPGRELFLGTRMFSGIGLISAGYAWTTRTSLTISGSFGRLQPVHRDTDTFTPLLGTATNASGGVKLTHSLSPRTEIGVSASVNKQISAIQDVIATSSSVFIGRKMGMHWFAQANGGTGWLRPGRQTYVLPTSIQYQAGGTLGYKTYGHTFLVTVFRGFADLYGLGAGSSVSTSGAWNWAHPRHSWTLSASVTHQSFLNVGTRDLSTLQTAVTFSRRLGVHFHVSADYAAILLSGSAVLYRNDPVQHAVRTSITWTPAAAR